jgi:AcrR family transcriptional regulator
LNGEATQASKRQRRRGRPPGHTDTKNSILDAARRLFAADGYGQTSIRAVAAESGVDSALVMHYFGSKEGLFRAAIEWPFDVDDVARSSLEGDIAGAGERLVGTLCAVWEDVNARHPLAVILRNAVQREEAARLLREFVQQELIGRLVAQSNDPHTDLRGSLVHSAIVGLFLSRCVIGIEPLASAPREAVVRAVGPTIQRYLTGDIDSARF